MAKNAVIFGSLLLLAGSVLGPLNGAEPLSWDFDRFGEPDMQGWELRGFSRAGADKGIFHLEYYRTAGTAAPGLFLGRGMPRVRSLAPGDYAAFEVKMRIGLTPAAPVPPPVLRLEWKWSGAKSPGIAELPVENSRSFKVYRIELSGLKEWKANGKKGCALVFYPVVSAGLGRAAVDIDYIRIIPAPRAELRDRLKTAEERLAAAEDRLAGLRRRGIVIPGAAEGLAEVRRTLDALKKADRERPEPTSAALAVLAAAEKKFFLWYGRLDDGRRLDAWREDIDAMVKTLDFRHSQGIAAPSALTEKIQAVRDELHRLNTASAVQLAAALDRLEPARRELWQTLNREDGKSPVWQAGLGAAGFGRFGWVNRETGLLVADCDRERLRRGYFVCGNGASPMLKFAPAGAVYVSGRPREITWVSSIWDYTYRTAAGRELQWTLRNSLTAPGPLLETDASEVTFAINAGTDLGPTKILAPTAAGPRIYPFDADLKDIPLSENWLLLLCDNGSSAVPWLLTFQHRPDGFVWRKDGFTVRRASGVGIIGLANPWGAFPLPVDWSKNWTSPPEPAVAQCRRIAAVMTCYPWQCDEFFAVDRAAGQVRVAEVIRHYRFANDWNAGGEAVAPLPPVLAFAVNNGYPAGLPVNAVDYRMPTKYGPYFAVAGTQAEYRLPLPDLRNPTPLLTDAFPPWRRAADKLPREFFPLKLEWKTAEDLPMRGLSSVFPSWCLLGEESQRLVAVNARLSLRQYFAQLKSLSGFDPGNGRSIERTEPFTGLSYLAYGWQSERWGKTLIGDITNFAGMDLALIYLYCKYTGDWQLARDHWNLLLRIFSVCPRRCDWAVMGQDCMEYGLTHTIDMGPDSWCAPVYMSKLAAAVGDSRTADLALYLTARQAVPLTAAFSKRQWDANISDTWDEAQIPETGYTEGGNISKAGWKRADIVYNFITGIVYSPECLNLYRDFCPQAAAKFEYDLLERYYPQWRDPTFKIKSGAAGLNAPGPIARHLFLREVLGGSTAGLAAIMRRGLLEDTGEPLWKQVNIGGLSWLSSAAAAVLIGRDAPCQPDDWSPARLLGAAYDRKTQKITARFSCSVPFTVTAIAATAPAAVSVNGKTLAAGDWSFDAVRRRLVIPVGPTGNTVVTLDYSGWTPPARRVVAAGPEPSPTPEMALCRSERQRQGKTSSQGNCQVAGETIRIDLAGEFNMALGSGAAGATFPWFGLKPGEDKNPSGSGLSNLSPGLRKFCGVPFLIANPKYRQGRAAVGLYGTKTPSLPRKVSVRVDKPLKKLYFLHTAGWDAGDGETVLRYAIRYADGASDVFNIRSGQEIGDWRSPRELPNARLAARIKTGPDKKGHEVGIYIAVWENKQYEQIAVANAATEQRPLKKIAAVEMESTGRDGAAAILAVTGELP